MEWTEIDEYIPYKCSYEMIHKSMKDMKADLFFIAATPKCKEFKKIDSFIDDMDKEILSTEKVWWIRIRNIPFQMVFLIPYMKTFISSAPALETLGSPDVYSVSDTFYTPTMNKTFGDRLGPNKDIGNNVFFSYRGNTDFEPRNTVQINRIQILSKFCYCQRYLTVTSISSPENKTKLIIFV